MKIAFWNEMKDDNIKCQIKSFKIRLTNYVEISLEIWSYTSDKKYIANLNTECIAFVFNFVDKRDNISMIRCVEPLRTEKNKIFILCIKPQSCFIQKIDSCVKGINFIDSILNNEEILNIVLKSIFGCEQVEMF